MTIELLAPAKINLGLEIIRRRPDGYHDIATVFQTISLFDRIRMRPSAHDDVQLVSRPIEIEANLAERALDLARATGLTKQCWQVDIAKRIPVAAGLGGASADAAAVLSGLASQSGVVRGKLAGIALALGSDVPFLVNGGAALAHGRGEELARIRALGGCWIVLASPDLELQHKTARLYDALTLAERSDGSSVEHVAAALDSGKFPASVDLVNAFERPLYNLLPELFGLRSAFISAGAPFVALTGAGPAHYTFVSALPRAIALARDVGRISPVAIRVLVARPTGVGPMILDKTLPDTGTL